MAKFDKPILDPDRIIKQIFDTNDIDVKTELDSEQIRKINLLMTLSDIFGNSLLEKHLVNFMRLQKSKSRSSLKEFVESLRSKKEEYIEKGKKSFQILG